MRRAALALIVLGRTTQIATAESQAWERLLGWFDENCAPAGGFVEEGVAQRKGGIRDLYTREALRRARADGRRGEIIGREIIGDGSVERPVAIERRTRSGVRASLRRTRSDAASTPRARVPPARRRGGAAATDADRPRVAAAPRRPNADRPEEDSRPKLARRRGDRASKPARGTGQNSRRGGETTPAQTQGPRAHQAAAEVPPLA